MNNDISLNKKATLLIILVVLQLVVLMINGMWGFASQHLTHSIPFKTITDYSLIASILMGISTLYLIMEIYRLTGNEQELERNKILLAENRDLIDTLRINRHDFANHLQTILGFVQLNKKDYAINYIHEISQDMKGQSTISNIKNLGIAALLLKKQSSCNESGVKLDVIIDTDLDKLKMPLSDITSILGNLIDNALSAVSHNVDAPQEIKLTIKTVGSFYKFSVFNFRPVIPEKLHEKLFEKGFTTKGINGSGLGLFIVKELTEKHKGTIQVISNYTSGTTFEAYLPIRG